MSNGCKESDWRLFRKRLPGWQEAYMDRLTKEYVAILMGEGLASDRFWALEKRVRADKHKAGVMVTDARRSVLTSTMAQLLREGAITENDLDGFSDELRESLHYSMQVDRMLNA